MSPPSARQAPRAASGAGLEEARAGRPPDLLPASAHSVFKTPGLRAPSAHERVFSISANGSPLADKSEVFLVVPLGGGEVRAFGHWGGSVEAPFAQWGGALPSSPSPGRGRLRELLFLNTDVPASTWHGPGVLHELGGLVGLFRPQKSRPLSLGPTPFALCTEHPDQGQRALGEGPAGAERPGPGQREEAVGRSGCFPPSFLGTQQPPPSWAPWNLVRVDQPSRMPGVPLEGGLASSFPSRGRSGCEQRPKDPWSHKMAAEIKGGSHGDSQGWGRLHFEGPEKLGRNRVRGRG